MKNCFNLFVSILFCFYGYSQELEWAKNIGSSYDDRCYDFTRDNLSNIYITGGFSNTVNFSPNGTPYFLNSSNGDNSDVYIAKYDATSNLLWANRIGNSEWEAGLSIETDSLNNVYIIGNYKGYLDFDPGEDTAALNALTMRYFLAKYDTNGSFQWVRDIGSDGNDWLTIYQDKLFIDKNAQVYTYLNTNDTLKKFNSQGVQIWQKQLSGTPDMGNKQNFYFVNGFKTAWSHSPSYQDSILLNKVDENGNVVYSNLMATSDDGYICGFIKYDENGNLFLSGQYWGDVSFYGLNDTLTISNHATSSWSNSQIKKEYIAKVDTLGFVNWVYSFNGVNGESPLPHIIRTNPNGDIFTLGYATGTKNFDPSSNTTIATYLNHYIAKYDSSFNYKGCSIFLGGSGNDHIANFEMYDDTAIICGHFFNTIDIDLTNSNFYLNATPPENIFMAKYSNFDIITNESSVDFLQEPYHDIQIYPNPSSGIISIDLSGDSHASSFIVYDITGNQLLNKNITENAFEMNFSNFSNGIYYLTFLNNGHSKSIKWIKCD